MSCIVESFYIWHGIAGTGFRRVVANQRSKHKRIFLPLIALSGVRIGMTNKKTISVEIADQTLLIANETGADYTLKTQAPRLRQAPGPLAKEFLPIYANLQINYRGHSNNPIKLTLNFVGSQELYTWRKVRWAKFCSVIFLQAELSS
jgi:hypothetical protein